MASFEKVTHIISGAILQSCFTSIDHKTRAFYKRVWEAFPFSPYTSWLHLLQDGPFEERHRRESRNYGDGGGGGVDGPRGIVGGSREPRDVRELREREMREEGRREVRGDGIEAEWEQKDWVRQSMDVVNADRREGRGRGLHRSVFCPDSMMHVRI